MPENAKFTELIQRVRAGEEQAVQELVRDYEPFIRRSIRIRLRDPRLRRVFDSTDICQSVLASFCVRAALGQYDLNEPDQLPKLLHAMARNKLAHQVQKQRAGRRDYRREEQIEVGHLEPVASIDTPSQIASYRELLTEVRRRLSPEELKIAELRDRGSDWAAIAKEMGGTADGRRMQLARAIGRIADELDLDGPK